MAWSRETRPPCGAADEDISTGEHATSAVRLSPHRRPPDNSTIWKLETDSMMFLRRAWCARAANGEPAHAAVPFGPSPASS